MTPTIYPYDIGCEPSPSGSAEVLLQSGWKAYLLFIAISQEVQANGYYEDFGVAIVECVNASSAKMGCPNDEGRNEHAFWNCGMSEIHDQMNRSAERIWGGRGMTWDPATTQKHFIITLKESTFECIADELKVVKFVSSYDIAFEYVLAEFKKH